MRIDTLSFLPQFLLNNPDIKELLNSEQLELDKFMNYIELMREQVFINSSSIYLTRYEKIFGLNVSPALSDQERIGRILAKLNTRTNSTVEAVKNVVTSITGCQTEIDEYYEQYKFMIHVLRDNSQIISIEDIKESVEVIKPAHLAFGVMMNWKWTIGLSVKEVIYKVAHDVCGDSGGEYDYCGETPALSYLGKIEEPTMKVDFHDKAYSYPYQFAGIYPTVSTLGTANDENGKIDVDIENYTTPLLFVTEDGDYCGED